MSWLEFNKIIASIILAIILFVIISFIGNFLIKTDETKEMAYKIEIPEVSKDSAYLITSDEENLEPIAELLINASLKNGEKVYKKCGTCHNFKKNSKSKVGPNLWDLINRPKGGADGFAYSKVLIDHGGKWTYEELNNFLYNPKKYIEGTKMNFVGLKNAQDRADVIFWLRSQSDNPVPLP
mgnify:CR=1 FL=1|tara:strand:+ start:1691 stop:2233 length:543 start_codon:yes stop_codon:yes gene_type:complete